MNENPFGRILLLSFFALYPWLRHTVLIFALLLIAVGAFYFHWSFTPAYLHMRLSNGQADVTDLAKWRALFGLSSMVAGGTIIVGLWLPSTFLAIFGRKLLRTAREERYEHW